MVTRSYVEQFISKVDQMPGGPALSANFIKDLTIYRFDNYESISESPLSSQTKVDLHLFVSTAIFLKIVTDEEVKNYSSANEFSQLCKKRFSSRYLKENHETLYKFIKDDPDYNDLNEPEYNATRLIFFISQKLEITPIKFDRVLYTLGSGRIKGVRYGQKSRMYVYQLLLGDLKDFELNAGLWDLVTEFTIKYFNEKDGSLDLDSSRLDEMIVDGGDDDYLSSEPFDHHNKNKFVKHWWRNRLNSGATMAAVLDTPEMQDLIARVLANSENCLEATQNIEKDMKNNLWSYSKPELTLLYLEYASAYAYYKQYGNWPENLKEIKNKAESICPKNKKGNPSVFGNNLNYPPQLYSFIEQYFKFWKFVKDEYRSSILDFYQNFITYYD